MRAPCAACTTRAGKGGSVNVMRHAGSLPFFFFSCMCLCVCLSRPVFSVPTHHYVATQLYEVDQVVTDLLGECTVAGAG